MDNVKNMLGGTPVRNGGMYNYVSIVQLTQETFGRRWVRWKEVCDIAHELGIYWTREKYCTLRQYHNAAQKYGLIITDSGKRSCSNQPEGWMAVA